MLRQTKLLVVAGNVADAAAGGGRRLHHQYRTDTQSENLRGDRLPTHQRRHRVSGKGVEG